MQIRNSQLKYLVPLILLISLVLFSIIPLTRTYFQDKLYPGDLPFYHERMAQYIKENNIPNEDPLRFTPYIVEPYHLLLSFFPNIYLASIIIQLLSGLLSVIFLYLILKELKINAKKISIILLIFIFSPISIFLFSTSNPYAILAALTLIGFYFYMKSNYAALIFILTTFFNPLFALPILAYLLSFSLYKNKMKKFYIALAAIILTFILHSLPFYLKQGLPKIIPIANIITDFGAKIGFSVFALPLFILGLYIVWRIQKQTVPYALLLSLLIISYYYTPLLVLLNIAISIFAAYGIMAFIEREWEIDLLKKLTILVIILGLLISSISYINRISQEVPKKDTIKSLEWFSTKDSGIILTHYSNAEYINSIAKKESFLHSKLNSKEKTEIAEAIFQGRNLIVTKNLLKQNNITHIWITKEMQEGGQYITTKQNPGNSSASPLVKIQYSSRKLRQLV